jgi:hypothetical protein
MPYLAAELPYNSFPNFLSFSFEGLLSSNRSVLQQERPTDDRRVLALPTPDLYQGVNPGYIYTTLFPL